MLNADIQWSIIISKYQKWHYNLLSVAFVQNCVFVSSFCGVIIAKQSVNLLQTLDACRSERHSPTVFDGSPTDGVVRAMNKRTTVEQQLRPIAMTSSRLFMLQGPVALTSRIVCDRRIGVKFGTYLSIVTPTSRGSFSTDKIR